MLLRQGARSFERWTGRPAPLDAMRRGLGRSKKALRAKPGPGACRYPWQWRSPARSFSSSSEPSCSAPRCLPCRTPGPPPTATRLRRRCRPSRPRRPPRRRPATPAPRTTLKSAFDLGDARQRASSPPSVTVRAIVAVREVRRSPAPSRRARPTSMPDFDVNARISAGGQKVDGGFVSLGDKAYFVRGDTGWRVPAAVWTRWSAASNGGRAAQQLPFEVHPDTWVRDVKSEGTDTIGGRQDRPRLRDRRSQGRRQRPRAGRAPERRPSCPSARRGHARGQAGRARRLGRRRRPHPAPAVGRGRVRRPSAGSSSTCASAT